MFSNYVWNVSKNQVSPKKNGDVSNKSTRQTLIFWRHWYFLETSYSDIMETFITDMMDFLWISDQNSMLRCKDQWMSYSCCTDSFQTTARDPINCIHVVSTKMTQNQTSQINCIFRRHRIHGEKQRGWKYKISHRTGNCILMWLKNLWEKSIGARSYTTKRQANKNVHFLFATW